MWLLILTAPMGAPHFAYVTRRSLCPVPCDVTPAGCCAVAVVSAARQQRNMAAKFGRARQERKILKTIEMFQVLFYCYIDQF